MKRYFIAPTADLPTAQDFGEWHFMDLEEGAAVVVLHDDHIEPRASWVELPHLLDAKTTLGDLSKLLARFGIESHHTAIEAAMKLAACHRQFRP